MTTFKVKSLGLHLNDNLIDFDNNDIKVALNDYIINRSITLENYITCYLAGTGLKVTDIVLIEQRTSEGLQFYCKPKEDKENGQS